MQWYSKSIDSSAEADILKGLICSNQFAKEIIPILPERVFQTDYANTIAKWCIGYYKRYDKVPEKVIYSIWESEKNTLQETIYEGIEIFLDSLGDQDEGLYNVQYELDKAEHYLKRRQLEQLQADITADLTKENIPSAESRVAKFKRIEKYSGESIDVFGKAEHITSSLMIEDNEDEVFSLPGVLGKFIGPFCRGDLYAVAGPGKRGKTWWLQEMAMRAVFSRAKVLFVSLEMTRAQMIRRIYQHLLGETRKPPREGEIIQIPYFFDDNSIQYRQTRKEGLQLDKALKKRNDIQKLIRGGMFRLICFPAYSIGIETLESTLDNLEYYDNFIPDVILADYADIFKPDIKGDERFLIDHTWKSFRSIAQKRHNVVITATHSNRSTFNRDVEQSDIVDDIRKINHVAGMFSLNQDKDDKRKGIMRIKIMAQRHDSFLGDDQVIVLQNLAIGKPYLDSRFKEDVKL
jgi:hypothetical protein